MSKTTTTPAASPMTSLTLTIPLPAHQHPPSSKRLLGLPPDLRNLIYHHTLVAPPKHSRTHHQDCHFRHYHTATSIEPAACHVLDVAVDPVPLHTIYRWETPVQCRCAKRGTLNLLLACRQIYHEAAAIFWSANTFVFDHPDEFTILVGKRLRAACRPLLRHVDITSPAPEYHQLRTTRNLLSDEDLRIAHGNRMPRWQQFWGVLKQCRGLRTLAVRPEVLRGHATDLPALGLWLPALERFELTWVGKYKDKGVVDEQDSGSFRTCASIQRETVFVRTAQAVDFGAAGFGDRQWCKDLYREFVTNFCVHVDSIVRERFLGCDAEGEDRRRVELHTGRVAAGLDDTRRAWSVTLPTGATAVLDFLAVPQSRGTRRRLQRERLARDAALRARGRPTAAEERERTKVLERRAENKSRAADEELRERERVLGERRRREEERKEEERREREDRRAELERAVEAAREERRVGRKRVARRGVEEEMGELAL